MDGAFDIETGLYTIPKFATTQKDYKCPDNTCGQPVFLRAGQKNRHHFSHYPNSKCTFYEGTGESHTHKTAKFVMAELLRTRAVEFHQTLSCCRKKTLYTTGNIEMVLIEARRPYGIPDIICVMKDGTEIIVEICHTHKTSNCNRTGTWFEISANDVLENHQNAKFDCMRHIECDVCIAEKKRKHLEWLANQKRIEQEECKRKEEYEIQQRILRQEEQKYREEFVKRKAVEEAESIERHRIQLEQEKELRKAQYEQSIKDSQERLRLAQIENHKRQLIRDQIEREQRIRYEEEKRIQRIKQEEEAEQKRKFEEYYKQVHKEFLCEIVDKYEYNPNIKPDTENVIYKNCDFLHPYHIIRIRNAHR